jgi:hypothetical protein
MVPWGRVAAFTLGLVTTAAGGAQPRSCRRAYLIIGAAPVAILRDRSLGANVAGDGDPGPLPYVRCSAPDITEALVSSLATWCLRMRRDRTSYRQLAPGVARRAVRSPRVCGSMASRCADLWFDVPLRSGGYGIRVWSGGAGVAVVIAALATMVLANRRYWRIA